MAFTHLLHDSFSACGAELKGEPAAVDCEPDHVTCPECLEVVAGKRTPISELPLSDVIDLLAFMPVDEPEQSEG